MDFEQKMARAQAIAQSGAVELVEERAVRILDRLVSAHRSQKLTDRDAAVGISTISALRDLITDMKSAVNQGIDAATELTRTV